MNESPGGWPKNFNPTPQIEGRRPANLLPQKFTGWPAGINKASNEAEELLSTAVAWWDANHYTPGDRFLRNRGIGGECLDLRLGSSTLPNSNDPLYLSPEDSGYVYIPNAASNYMSTDNRAGTASTWSFSIKMNWTNSNTYQLAFDRSTASNYNLSAYMQYATVGPRLIWVNGSNTPQDSDYLSVTKIPDGTILWYRFTIDATGANTICTVEYAPNQDNEPTSWTLHGTKTINGTTGITIPNIIGTVGTLAYATNVRILNSFIYRAIERINNIVVLDIDCNDIESGETTSFSAKTGQLVTVNRSTSGRKSVCMPSKKNGGRPCFLFGTDDYMEIPADRTQQHQLLNFGQSDTFTLLVILRPWANISSGQTLIRKGGINQAVPTTPRWMTRYITGNQAFLYLDDGQVLDAIGFAALDAGDLQVLAATVPARTASNVLDGLNRIVTYRQGVLRNTSQRNVRSMANQTSMDILRDGDAEFTAAAIFRRALTQQEINILTTYFQNLNKFTYSPPSDTDQKNFMAARLGVSSSASALDILKDAPFYIDSRNFSSGSQYIQNLGWRRDGLNTRLGSSGASDSNDPLYLTPESNGYVYLPGVFGNFLSVPDEAALDITGDIDLQARVTFDETTADVNYGIISKSDIGSNRSFEWRFIGGIYGLTIEVSSNGSSVTQVDSRSTLPYGNGVPHWVRVTWRASDGRVQFFTAPDQLSPPSSWTQLGTNKTAAVGSLYAGTANVYVGARYTVTSPMSGRMYRAIIKNGIDGTTVLDIDTNSITSASATSFTAVTGQTVSINRSTAGRKSTIVPSISNNGKPVFLLGTDDYFEVDGSVQQSLLNFDSGEPFSILLAYRPWNTLTSGTVLFAKSGSNTAATNSNRWLIRYTTSNGFFGILDDARNAAVTGSRFPTIGNLELIGMIASNTSVQTSLGNSLSTAGSRNQSPINTWPVRIGTLSSGTTTVATDFEFYAAAIFRRALNTSELSTLTTFFTT